MSVITRKRKVFAGTATAAALLVAPLAASAAATPRPNDPAPPICSYNSGSSYRSDWTTPTCNTSGLTTAYITWGNAGGTRGIDVWNGSTNLLYGNTSRSGTHCIVRPPSNIYATFAASSGGYLRYTTFYVYRDAC